MKEKETETRRDRKKRTKKKRRERKRKHLQQRQKEEGMKKRGTFGDGVREKRRSGRSEQKRTGEVSR